MKQSIGSTKHNCTYVFNNSESCKRVAQNGSYCQFHELNSQPSKLSAEQYYAELKALVDKRDGNWKGFIFPDNFVLENLAVPIAMDARNSKFQALTMNTVKFCKQIDVSGSIFNKQVIVSSLQFKDSLLIRNSQFHDKVEARLTCIDKQFLANKTEFHSDFMLSGTVEGVTNFNRSRFCKLVNFVATKVIKGTARSELRAPSSASDSAVTPSQSRSSKPWIHIPPPERRSESSGTVKN